MGPSGGGCRYQKKYKATQMGIIQEEMFKMANRCLSLKYSMGDKQAGRDSGQKRKEVIRVGILD